MKTLKRTVVSGLSVVGKWARYIHRRAWKLFVAHSAVWWEPKGT
jgi:hypothetical protein